MFKKVYLLFFVVAFMNIFSFNHVAKAVGPGPINDYVTEINSSGKLVKGEVFVADRPVIRPTYQGDYKTIFKDAIGPDGAFEGYYDAANHNSTSQYLQQSRTGDTLIFKIWVAMEVEK